MTPAFRWQEGSEKSPIGTHCETRLPDQADLWSAQARHRDSFVPTGEDTGLGVPGTRSLSASPDRLPSSQEHCASVSMRTCTPTCSSIRATVLEGWLQATGVQCVKWPSPGWPVMGRHYWKCMRSCQASALLSETVPVLASVKSPPRICGALPGFSDVHRHQKRRARRADPQTESKRASVTALEIFCNRTAVHLLC